MNLLKRTLILFLVLITTAFSGTLNLCSSCQIINTSITQSQAHQKSNFECPYHKKTQQDQEQSKNDNQKSDVCLKCLLSFADVEYTHFYFSYELIGVQEFREHPNFFSFYLELSTPPPIFS